MRIEGLLRASQPTARDVGGDPYLEWLSTKDADKNEDVIDVNNNLPGPKATPMGVVGSDDVIDNRYTGNSGAGMLYNLTGESMLMSPEEEERRKRRAETAAAVGNLGKLMSGFANLYYVNKGAPSQVLPNSVMPDYMTFTDRVNQARRTAMNDQLQRERLQQQMDYQNESIALRKQQEQRLNESARLAWRKQDWLEKYQAGVLDIKAEQNRINDEYKKGQISIQEWRAANDELKAHASMLNANTNSARESRLAGGQTIEETDKYGYKTTKVVTPNRSGSSNKQGGRDTGGAGSTGSWGNTINRHRRNN